MTEKEIITYIATQCAVNHSNICPDEYTWAQCARIIKRYFGMCDEGIECFDTLSRGCDNYKDYNDCRNKYKAVRASEKQSIATLIMLAENCGITIPHEYNGHQNLVTTKPKPQPQPRQYNAIALGEFHKQYPQWGGVLPFAHGYTLHGAKYHVSMDNGAVVYPYMADGQKVLTAKAIRYMDNGHRNKNTQPYYLHTSWADDYHAKRCLFGQHLVNDNVQVLCVVEAEKTAIVMDSIVSDDLVVWLAVGGANNMQQHDILQELKKLSIFRQVLLFPDIDAVEAWTTIADKYGWSVFDIGAFKHMGDKIDIADIYLSSSGEDIATANNMLEVQINDMLN